MQRDLSRTHLRSTRCAVALAFLLTSVACSGSKASDENAAADPAEPAPVAAASTTTNSSQPAPAADAPSSPKPSAPKAAAGAAFKPAPKLTSLGGGTVSAGDLHDAYFYWKDQTVTVAGFAALPSKRGRWGSRVYLGAVGEPKAPRLVECKMASKPEGRLAPDTTLVLRGTFDARYFAVRDGEPARVRLNDCELISSGEPLPEGSDPRSLGPEPVLAQDFHDAVLGWQGKTVQTSGYFKGSTYSSASDTTSHAIKSGADGATVVHCNESGKATAPDRVKQDRASAVVEGTLAQPTWSEVVLDDCRWVSG